MTIFTLAKNLSLYPEEYRVSTTVIGAKLYFTIYHDRAPFIRFPTNISSSKAVRDLIALAKGEEPEPDYDLFLLDEERVEIFLNKLKVIQ